MSRPGELQAALDGQRVLADEAWRDLLTDDAVDLEKVRVLVARDASPTTPSSVWTRVMMVDR